MFPAPTIMNHRDIPTGAMERASLRMASLVDAGEDIRPTRHGLVVFALAMMANTVGEIRFDPAGLTPERQTPADIRFAMSAQRTVAAWHAVLPAVSVRKIGDGTVLVKRADQYPPRERSPRYRCWHDHCPVCQ